MRHRLDRLALVIAVTGFTACAPSLFERHLDAHRWEAAAEAFASDSRLHRNEHALYEVALLYATPGTAVHDPERARALLDRLQQMHPQTRQHARIVRLRAMLGALERAAAVEQCTRDLQDDIATLRLEVERLRLARDHFQMQVTGASAVRDSLRREVIRLEADLKGRELEVRALQTELARLKAIDLRPPKVPTAATPPQAGEATQPLSGWR